MRQAHVPYSSFPVGAAILSETGKIYAGCNIENAAYPEGWCAETSAISHMIVGGERRIVEIAVVAEKMARITPCGGCGSASWNSPRRKRRFTCATNTGSSRR